MNFAVGSLVKTRGREWVVLPESQTKLLKLRPLGGREDEVTCIHTDLETVESASFSLPQIQQIGDYRSCRILRDAIRLGFRSSAGPFRSFAKISVEARPYQLVPLLLALKQDPVRILIADDVGIGKTIEACLIARELLDRGEIQRIAVLCPPHLAEQWQWELRDKFHISAELLLASTARHLERQCLAGQSIFDVFPYLIISIDFIKSDRRRDDFLRNCPEFVIVDEAHTCAYETEKTGKHQRHLLLQGLAQNPQRHLVLVTATPHSGKGQAFRSLLSILSNELQDLPENLMGAENEKYRRILAKYFVQRRRADIKDYLKKDTPFPQRLESEDHYELSPEYKKLFSKVLAYAEEIIHDKDIGKNRQRIRWWSILALLRSLASSPAAAAATLETRAANAEAETLEDINEIGRCTVLDLNDSETAQLLDIAPGSNTEEESTNQSERLRNMAKQAKDLFGKDNKLIKAIDITKVLVKQQRNIIIFCRFIPTAEYVADELRQKIGKQVEIAVVTGLLPPAERESRIMQLGKATQRILVCTDCLSEGINLQEHFDTVFHYDLSWNPTRHEQREGRVDRFGQPRNEVQILTYYGLDNKIDGIVLAVLLRKHKNIRKTLGVSVPIPVESNNIIEAVFEGILLRKDSYKELEQTVFDFFQEDKQRLHLEWDNVADRETRSQTMFVQRTIKAEEVAMELEEIRQAVGAGVDVAQFLQDAAIIHNATVATTTNDTYIFQFHEAKALRETIGDIEKLEASFELPVADNVTYLHRTHPIVEGIASYIVDTALDHHSNSLASRVGVIRCNSVNKLTTLLLLRIRYHIIVKRLDQQQRLLAEDCLLTGFCGRPNNPSWLSNEDCEALLQATPQKNLSPQEIEHFLKRILDNFSQLEDPLQNLAKQRAQELLKSHRRVRDASGMKKVFYKVEPELPPDVLGIYVYLPAEID